MDWLDRLRSHTLALAALALVLLALSPRPLAGEPFESLDRARIALQNGRIAAALDHLDTALAFEPALAPLRLQAARLALEGGEPARARSYLASPDAIESDPEQAGCLLTTAEVLLEPQAQREERLLNWVESCPQVATYATSVAMDLFESPEPTQALPYLRALVATGTERLEILEAYALIMAATEPWQAESDLAMAVERGGSHLALAQDLLQGIRGAEPDAPRSLALLQAGLTLARHGEWALARLAFQAARDLDPENALAAAYLGLAADQLDEDGLPFLERARQIDPTNALPHLLLAMHWQRAGDPARAREALERAARLAPEDPAIAAQLGGVYAELGDLPAAAAAYRLAAELAPEEPRFWLLLAEFSIRHVYDLESLGKPAARNALAMDIRSAQAWSALGQIHLLQEQTLLAQRCLYRAVTLAPLDPRIQVRFGMLQQALGDLNAARAAFARAADLDLQGSHGDLALRLIEALTP